jgi:hypothetical protein
MCDYSLQNVKSRPATVDDKLVTKNFGTGTIGFAAVDNPEVAVCVLPGTEIAFEEAIVRNTSLPYTMKYEHAAYTTGRFRQINRHTENMHHDALELPDGEVVMLTMLSPGQRAKVLQLPAAPKNDKEAEEQTRLSYTEGQPEVLFG